MDEIEIRLGKLRDMVPSQEEKIPNEEVAIEIDSERDQIIKEMNKIWSGLGIPELPVPTEVRRSEDVWPKE